MCGRAFLDILAGVVKSGGLPTLEDVEKMDLDVVELTFRSDRELRFRVSEQTMYPGYRPFHLVFIQPRSFTGPEEMFDVWLCVRGPSVAADGVVFEFESRSIVPTEGRPVQVQALGGGKSRILFGKTVSAVEARIVAASVTVDAAPDE
jgi:hypothetical protein